MTVADNILSQGETVVVLQPQFEGANVGPWIGFKHVNYLIEEAVLTHFRRRGYDVRTLYADYGLCFEMVDIDTRIIRALRLEDEFIFHVSLSTRTEGPQLEFDVVVHDKSETDKPNRMALAKVSVLLRRDSLWPSPARHVPLEAVDRIERVRPDTKFGSGSNIPLIPDLRRLVSGRNAFAWKMRIPYFYCHFTERLQMSGYLRVMEEAIDRLLTERGVSIRDLLDECRLIPAVPRSRISILGEAYMEEELHTVLIIDQVFKNLTFTVSMECYVIRDGAPVTTAVGAITHGYAQLDGRDIWNLAHLNDRLRTALSGST